MKKILVIDDNDMIRDELVDIISKKIGVIVKTAQSSRQGIQMLQAEAFDFIVCDLEMPEENGLVVWKYINEKKMNIGFVLFTGQSHHQAAQLPQQIHIIYNKNFFKLLTFLKNMEI